MIVDATITVVCEAIGPRCEFRALFYDPPTCSFYGGSGATALEAVEWCVHEYVARGVLQRGVSMARDPNARPGNFGALTACEHMLIAASAPIEASRWLALADDAATFDRSIPKRPAPMLFGAPPTPKTSRRAARSR